MLTFPLPPHLDPLALAACGVDTPDLVPVLDPEGPWLERETLGAFQELSRRAAQAGFRLRVESGHRPFERQLSIWNRKAQGLLPLLDGAGKPLRRSDLDDSQCLSAILAWSALPGTSRHHWGTDLDLVDEAAIPLGYEVELTPAECAGMFAPMHAWLDERLKRGEACGFRRVFEPGRGRVRPERWHLSYAPAARRYERAFDGRLLPGLYEACGLELKNEVLALLPELIRDYVACYFTP